MYEVKFILFLASYPKEVGTASFFPVEVKGFNNLQQRTNLGTQEKKGGLGEGTSKELQ